MSHSVPIQIIPRWRSIAEQGAAAFFAALFFIALGLLVMFATWHLTPHPATDAQRDSEAAAAP